MANIFLHYVLDLWVHQWRKREARGQIVIVRYCDDFVLGFQSETDARRVCAELRERLAKFNLVLHDEKTRLIEFGRRPALRRARRGERRPRTFAFLGFTHYCAWTRRGYFMVKRKTERKRMTRKLKEIRRETWRRMHAPVAAQHRWLCSVLRGHYAYYGVPSNLRAMAGFCEQVRRIWYQRLKRRSQRSNLSWPRFIALLEVFVLPPPRITRPYDALQCRLG